MRTSSRLFGIFLLTCVAAPACGGSQAPPDVPSDVPSPSTEPAPSSSDAAKRPELTAEACQAGGGTVVGDIGDGAIHRPDYKCANGAPPSGTIRPPEGGPIAVEGSVCCPK